MASRNASIAFAVVALGIASYALLRTENAPASTGAAAAATPTSNLAPVGTAGPLPMGESTPLPPGHPAIGASAAAAPTATSTPALAWNVPAGWTVLPNPTAVRLATYRVPRAPGDTDDTDVSVTRAGGTADANIDRWLTQFDARGKETRTESTTHGLKVTVVDLSGTYLGSGMTPGAAPVSHPGWSPLAAIAEGSGLPCFVKITGPTASVQAARPAFDSLVASVRVTPG